MRVFLEQVSGRRKDWRRVEVCAGIPQQDGRRGRKAVYTREGSESQGQAVPGQL